MTLSRRGLPLYYLVREALRRDIAVKKPGDQLPTEPKLMKRMGVSRITVRYALEQLQAEGLITRVQGRGTFVAYPSVRPDLRGLSSFLNDISASGQIPSTKAVRVARMLGPPDAHDRLQIEPSSRLMCVEKIRMANGVPVSFEISFILPEIAGAWTKKLIEKAPIFDLLKDHGVRLSRGTVEVAAVLSSTEMAKHLRIRKGAPLLRVDRVIYDRHDRPIEYDILHYRSDRVRYSFETHSEAVNPNLDAKAGFKLVWNAASGGRS
jgi:GntR family transcriptional regulator